MHVAGQTHDQEEKASGREDPAVPALLVVAVVSVLYRTAECSISPSVEGQDNLCRALPVSLTAELIIAPPIAINTRLNRLAAVMLIARSCVVFAKF